MSRQPVKKPLHPLVEKLLVDIQNPLQYKIYEHVGYFSQNLLTVANELSGVRNLDHDSFEALKTALTEYAMYLAKNMTEINTQQVAYLISALNSLIAKRFFSFEACFLSLSNALIEKWLSEDNQYCPLRFEVQYFYQLSKLLKTDKKYLTHFVSIYQSDKITKIKVQLSIKKILESGKSDSQHISNIFLALGYLAQQGKVYDFPLQNITEMLSKLLTLNPDSQHISNIFLALGYLAQKGKVYDLPSKIITDMLSRLSTLNPNSQCISNIFLALGYLAQQGKVYDLPLQIITEMLSKSLTANPEARHISNIFLSLGYLAQQGKVYELPLQIITDMLSKLLTLNPDSQHISNIFLALGYLAQSQRMQTVSEITQTIAILFKEFERMVFSSDFSNHNTTVNINQVVISCYQQHYFLNTPLSDLSRLESIVASERPAENFLQQQFKEKFSREFSKDAKTEVLICGYFVDMVIDRLIIEFDGSQHYRHGVLRAEDALRDELLLKAGYRVIRIKNEDAEKMLFGKMPLPSQIEALRPLEKANEPKAPEEKALKSNQPGFFPSKKVKAPRPSAKKSAGFRLVS